MIAEAPSPIVGKWHLHEIPDMDNFSPTVEIFTETGEYYYEEYDDSGKKLSSGEKEHMYTTATGLL